MINAPNKRCKDALYLGFEPVTKARNLRYGRLMVVACHGGDITRWLKETSADRRKLDSTDKTREGIQVDAYGRKVSQRTFY